MIAGWPGGGGGGRAATPVKAMPLSCTNTKSKVKLYSVKAVFPSINRGDVIIIVVVVQVLHYKVHTN